MPIFSRFPVLRPLGRVAAVCVVVASLSACKELTSIDAGLPNISDTATVFAINGTPQAGANAINLFATTFMRADQNFNYDIAFDIAQDGRVLVIPVRALASSFSNPYSVGLQIVPGISENLTEAPEDGYVLDSAVTVGQGATVAIESHNIQVCAYAIKGQSYHSKITITRIDPVLRSISLAFTVNRNCGFRSFAAGYPKD